MATPSVDTLREQVRARVVTAEDDDYDDLRNVMNGMFDRRPAVIVRAEQVPDVVATIGFARDAGVDLSIRGGGHSAPAFGTNDGGVVIDLSLMRGVHVDPAARTARAGGGATWGDFNYATHQFGLATTGGIVSTTGVGGLTLGGGIGYLSRSHGLSIDNLLSAEVVTANGDVLTASTSENPDLFWALRGGGGNFGVVTSLEFRLHLVKDVVVGLFFYDLDVAGDLLRFFREWIKDAPRAYGGFPAFHLAPPLPFVPEDRQGSNVCAAIVHWSGPIDEGEAAMKPFQDVGPVLGSMVSPMPYPWLNSAFDPFFPKGLRSYWKASFVKELSDDAIARHVEHGSKVPEMSALMHLYPINGACHDVGSDDTAFANRDALFAEVIVAGWSDPAADAERVKWVRDYYDATAPLQEAAGYINFMDADDQSRITTNYGKHYERLVEAKRTYDPGNLFHLNQNIKP